MLAFLEAGEAAWAEARRLASSAPPSARLPAAAARLHAPLPAPPALRDFFAFEAHARAGAERRKEPFPEEWYRIPAFYKGNHREVYGPEDEVPWPAYTRRLDFECEIACVIGKKGRDLSPERSEEHTSE